MTGFSISVPESSHDSYDDSTKWAGTAGVRGPKWARLPLLTLGTLGMQILWSVEMGYASPYLISLGLSKSLMSMVFVAGPLSGLIMQPLVGAFSDRCTSKFGRRRPYLVGGTLVSTVALLLLGYTKNVASIFGLSDEHRGRLTIWLAVVSIYFIDFSVNAAMACTRALLVDILPVSEQEVGNAWAGRMSGIGSIAGFFVGNIKLSAIFPFLGDTQLQVLAALSALLLICTNGATAFAVKERILLKITKEESGNDGPHVGIFSTIREIWANMWTLPYVIMRICIIQFLSWIGWFPVLFYTTLWVTDIYTRANLSSTSFDSSEDILDAGTRAGNRALLYSSIVAMIAFIVLPLMVSRPEAHHQGTSIFTGRVAERRWWQIEMHVATLWAISNAVFAASMAATWFTDSVRGADMVIGATGFSWAVSLWAPFALLGEQIHSSEPSRAGYGLAHDEEDIPLRDRRTDREETPMSAVDIAGIGNGNLSARASRSNLTDEADDDNTHTLGSRLEDGVPAPTSSHNHAGVGDKAGVILGIYNVFIVIPQFIVTGISAVVFAIAEPGVSTVHLQSETNPITPLNGTVVAGMSRSAVSAAVEAIPQAFDSIGFMFRLGGLCAGFASILCWRLSKHLQR